MNLPSNLKQIAEWTFAGPMGPLVPDTLQSLPVVGVDGGANYTSKLDVWVGDSDSLSVPLICDHQFKHPTSKAHSDLALALSLFIENLPYRFHFWGFLGGRKDHELFNLGEAMTFLVDHPLSQIIFYGENDKEYFHLFGPGVWNLHHHGLFSIGSIKSVSLTLTGKCRYPIGVGVEMEALSSFGLSNEGQGEMTLINKNPVFVYFPEGK